MDSISSKNKFAKILGPNILKKSTIKNILFIKLSILCEQIMKVLVIAVPETRLLQIYLKYIDTSESKSQCLPVYKFFMVIF